MQQKYTWEQRVLRVHENRGQASLSTILSNIWNVLLFVTIVLLKVQYVEFNGIQAVRLQTAANWL